MYLTIFYLSAEIMYENAQFKYRLGTIFKYLY